jgi:polyisoprenoid-binding protein YceI
MVLQPGRHQLGPDRGQIMLRTFRDGLAATAGHDLTIEATRWSGVLEINDDLSPASLEVRIEMGALAVRGGTGGIKPLSDRDRREIAVTARKVLAADRYPEAVFATDTFAPAPSGGEISGTFTLRGTARPLTLRVSETGPDRYHAEATVVQSGYGIKPYTAFLGALRVRDAIDVAIDVDLSGPAGGTAGGSPGGQGA